MPKGSKELENARREEIVDACERLYAERAFNEITVKDIGEVTSFTRTSIYNYFINKEEIFLALLEREYMRWGDGLEAAARTGKTGAEAFAEAVATTLAERPDMLKLLAMNMYDMEGSSRPERLVAFKRAYGRTMKGMKECYKAHFPGAAAGEADNFVRLFYPVLFGIYPYTHVTEKQKNAMKEAHIEYDMPTVYGLTYDIILKLL